MKIKVLFYSHDSNFNGATRSLLLLIKNMDKNKFEPIVICPRKGIFTDELEKINIPYYIVKYLRWIYTPFARKGSKIFRILRNAYTIFLECIAIFKTTYLIRRENPDVIYTNTTLIIGGMISSILTKKPHIWHLRERILEDAHYYSLVPKHRILNLISKNSVSIITSSKFVAEQFSLDIQNKKVTVIQNALEITKLDQDVKLEVFNETTSPQWYVAIIGYFENIKAQDIALKAVHLSKKAIPNIKLILIGEKKGEYYQYLRKLINELNLSQYIYFSGYQYNVFSILKRSHLLLTCSCHEGFGRTVMEAMSVSIPVIGVDSGGVKEIIDDNVTGFLVPPCNPEKMAEKMIYLYNNPQIAKKFGENGNRIVSEQYNPKQYVKSIEDVIISYKPTD